jgi:hypothetical protein
LNEEGKDVKSVLKPKLKLYVGNPSNPLKAGLM